MKQKLKGDKKWFTIIFIAFQVGIIFIIRSYTSGSDHTTIDHDTGHKRWRTNQLMSASSSLMSWFSADNNHQKEGSVSTLSITTSPIRQSAIRTRPAQPTLLCDRSHRLYDWCHLKSRAILEPRTATFFTRSSTSNDSSFEKVRPYPAKGGNKAMSHVREITLTTKSSDSQCEVYHDSPALVFSTGGFTGNFFHDFSDGFVPLFITINTLFPNQDVTLVISDFSNWWYGKFEAMLPSFSKNRVINLDNQTVTHCFPSVAVGLISHGPMTIDPALIPHRRSFLDLRASLEEAYRKCPTYPTPKIKGRPRLVLVSRVGAVGRVILNQDDVIKAAQEQGFDVVIFEPSAYTYLCDAYKLINGSHAMMGVHGAALSHSLFLRPGAAFIQVVPLGGDWVANTYFGNLAKGLKLKYMEYKVEAKESSLAKKYGKDHILLRDSNSIASSNWTALHSIYLRNQNVTLDIPRFRVYLKQAYAKAKTLMQEQGLHVRRRTKVKKYIRPPVFNYTYGLG